MDIDPYLSEIRFGTGLSPMHDGPHTVQEMLNRLIAPDQAAADFPIETFAQFQTRVIDAREKRRAMRKNKDPQKVKELKKAFSRVKRDARRARADWLMQTIARRSHTNDGFRERLLGFWTDHFTVIGKGSVMRRVALPVAETFIRPNMTGPFAKLLIEGVTSPGMVNYLDQQYSIGPNAPARDKANDKRGLNENLAREVLELHTLGAGGPYTQDDVRQLAELLTGLGIQSDGGRIFRPKRAEPGPETVLGRSYGGDPAELAHIHQVLEDLARHPVTARHICTKLAVHFLGDAPDPDAIARMTAAWLDTDGHLLSVYQAMLTHPAAWEPQRQNVKLPFDFMSSALRALALRPDPIRGKANDVEQRIKKHFMDPLRRMGQPWGDPLGPDGWPEEDEAWITPQGLATRMEWALRVPQALLPELPDPRQFVTDALGPTPPEPVRFAARAAENKAEGIALVLISPAFQRR